MHLWHVWNCQVSTVVSVIISCTHVINLLSSPVWQFLVALSISLNGEFVALPLPAQKTPLQPFSLRLALPLTFWRCLGGNPGIFVRLHRSQAPDYCHVLRCRGGGLSARGSQRGRSPAARWLGLRVLPSRPEEDSHSADMCRG